jgi:hypothetical protein
LRKFFPWNCFLYWIFSDSPGWTGRTKMYAASPLVLFEEPEQGVVLAGTHPVQAAPPVIKIM